jgi:hypothetical protein
MRSKHFFVLILVSLSIRLVGIDCGCVYASDEVDYSAPYLTVENGELVTRYPAREHAADDAPVEAGVDEVVESPQNEPISWLVWGLLAVIVVVAGIRRHRHQGIQP